MASIIATLSPALSNLEETISTLRFASRSRLVSNKAVGSKYETVRERIMCRTMNVEEIKKIAESAMKEIEDGNEVLSKWQHKIYQDNCLERSVKGAEYHNPRLEKRYEDWAIVWFLDHIVKSEQYRSIANK